MRRAVRTLVVLMLFTVGSSSALGATQHLTIRAVVAQASWDTYDPDTGNGESGGLQFATFDGQTTAFLAIFKGELVLCSDGGTPDDPTDDAFGFRGSETVGQGPARLTLGRSYSSAVASSTVQAEVFTYDECTGDAGTATAKTIRVRLDLTGVSPIITQRLRSTVSIPSQLRSKTLIRSETRDAAGTARVGTRSIGVDGVIGRLQLRAQASD